MSRTVRDLQDCGLSRHEAIVLRRAGMRRWRDHWREVFAENSRIGRETNRRPAEAHKGEGPEVCVWAQIEDGDDTEWSTSCGQEWTMEMGSPEESGYHYCPMCGKPLEYPARPAEAQKGEG